MPTQSYPHRLTLALLLVAALAACAPHPTPPPTPTRTPIAVTPTPGPVFPSLDTLAGLALGQPDLQPGYTPDPTNTGPLTPDLLAEQSGPQTAQFVRGLPTLYGYQTAYLRASSVEQLAGLRDWLLVFEDAQQAALFAELHPSLLSAQPAFVTLDFPALGDGSAAYRATSPGDGPVALDRHDVVLRRRNLVAVAFLVTATGQANTGELELYARLLDARLADTLAAPQP